MHCFNHSEVEAVGTCKVCQRGICHTCATDLKHSIACKGTHEELAEATHDLVLRGMRVQRAAGKTKYLAPLLYGFMGLLFTGFGLREEKVDNFVLFVGFGFVVFALVTFFANRRAVGAGRDAA